MRDVQFKIDDDPRGAGSLVCGRYASQFISRAKKDQTESVRETAIRILQEIMKFRRMSKRHPCIDSSCVACQETYLPKIISAVEASVPVKFILPAFPAKSPNPEKVLGLLPDMAEEKSIKFLDELCERIRSHYILGAHIILCSDGRVFNDVVGIRDEDVCAYQQELARYIVKLSSGTISTFHLENAFKKNSFAQMREELLNQFGRSLSEIKEKVENGGAEFSTHEEKQAVQIYRGITRFLFEDSNFQGQSKSRTTRQKEARSKAYEVIRRSDAWSELIKAHFVDAVRLSIHPQVCRSEKLGIRLIGQETWMTPWHGVAVETEKGFVLMKRAEAESLGARLIQSPEGRPSHFKLTKNLKSNLGTS